jgi:hypothetical protein
MLGISLNITSLGASFGMPGTDAVCSDCWVLVALVATSFTIACASCCLFCTRRGQKLPESLIPKINLDRRVMYAGKGTFEARQGNAMWCQDSAVDYFEHGACALSSPALRPVPGGVAQP